MQLWHNVVTETDTLRTEQAIQVGANPRNKLFHVGMLGLRATSNGIKKGHEGVLTLLCSGTSSSIQNGLYAYA